MRPVAKRPRYRMPAELRREIASDLLILAGTLALCFGLWQYSPPSAFVIGGCCAMGLGFLIGRGE